MRRILCRTRSTGRRRLPLLRVALVLLIVPALACDAAPRPAPPPSATPMVTGTSIAGATPSRDATSTPPAASALPTSTPALPAATPAPMPPAATMSPPSPSSPSPTATPASTGTVPPGRPSPVPSPTATQVPLAHVAMALGTPLPMRVGTAGDLPGGRVLAFTRVVGDSRCPADVQCVWAGEANLAFEWREPAGPTRSVLLAVSGGSGAGDLGGGMRLRVLSLAPAPAAGRAIDQGAYLAAVVIESGAVGSGSYGVVRVGPSCPVQRESDPCPDRPLAATLVIRDPGGAEVARTLSDAAGFYAVALPPGRYTIVPFTPAGATLPRGIPRDIEVPAGQWIPADISYDSGIR